MSVPLENIQEVEKPKQWLGVRHIQVVMSFLALTLLLTTRVSMSIAIVAMTDPNNANYFDWTIQRQGVILSSFSWGYILIQAPAGEIASKFGGRNFLLLMIVTNSLMSLVLPVAAIYGGWTMVCACRVIQGLMQGPIYATLHYIIGKWVPPEERGRMSSLIFSGNYFGSACQLMVAGYIAEYLGWTAIFYINGAAGLIWTAIYLIVGSDNPQVSKLISNEERLYIQHSLGQVGGHKRLKTPWKAILTSSPYLAAVTANVGFSFGYWVLLTETPTYMSKVLQVNIKANGVMSALPYLSTFIMNFPVGFASDFILRKNWVSVTTCRKIFNSIGFFGPALVLICLSYVPAGNVTLAVTLLCLTLGLCAGYYGGYIILFLDLAQNFSSTLMAMSNFVANVAGLFAPLFAGFVLHDESDPKEWRIIFFVSATLYVVANIVFLIFATSEEQDWNKGTEKPKSLNKE